MLFRPVVATFASLIAIVASMLPLRSTPDRPEDSAAVRFEPRWRYVVALVGEHVAVSFDLVNASDHPIRVTDVECKWGTLRVDTLEGESIPALQGRRGLAAPIAVAAGAHLTLVDAFDPALECEPESSEECFVRAWIESATEPIEAGIHWRRRWFHAVHGGPEDFGELTWGETVERRFVLEAEELGRFKVDELHFDPPDSAFALRGRDVTEPGATRTAYEVVVGVSASKLRCGEHYASIVAALGNARVPSLRINVHAKVVPGFELLVDGKPANGSVAFGVVHKIGSASRRVVVHSRRRDVPVHVTAARVESEGERTSLTASVGTCVDGETTIDLGLAETPKERNLRGELVLKTDDPSAPEWRLKISVIWVANAATTDGR